MEIIKLLARLMSSAESEPRLDVNGNKLYKFATEWQTEQFEHFFKQIEPFMQHNIINFNYRKNGSEFMRSIVAVVKHTISSLTLLDLIQTKFLINVTTFLVKNAPFNPFIILQVF